MKFIASILFLFFSASTFSQSKVAVVKLIRGEVDVLTLGKTTKLMKDDWVQSGAIVRTAEKSFVKLVFIDKSQMNVGPNSEMKIESFSGKDSGVIDLVKGQIRSQVTKDYLQIQNRDKSKLFIKTKNAVMGVRGTDFIISTNGKNTSTILFKGEVVFNRLDNNNITSSSRLEEIVDRGVRLFPGEFSVMEHSRTMPTVPSLLNVQQKIQLEKNKEFDADRAPSNAKARSKSVVPPGLNGQQVSNNSKVLKTEISQIARVKEPQLSKSSSAVNPEGFVNGNMVKPVNGSFVHIDSGVIIPPGPGSILDANTNTYIPSQESGHVATDGSYVPPKNVEITNDGKILVATTDSTGATVVQEASEVIPSDNSGVAAAEGNAPSSSATSPTMGTNSDISFGDTSIQNPVSGGISGVNDPTRVISPYSDVTIRVKPTP